MVGHCDRAANTRYVVSYTAFFRERILAEVCLGCKSAIQITRCFRSKLTLVWIGIWKKILVWNGTFLVWNVNGMEENCQYGI